MAIVEGFYDGEVAVHADAAEVQGAHLGFFSSVEIVSEMQKLFHLKLLD